MLAKVNTVHARMSTLAASLHNAHIVCAHNTNTFAVRKPLEVLYVAGAS
jgi:hypothetical protein